MNNLTNTEIIKRTNKTSSYGCIKSQQLYIKRDNYYIDLWIEINAASLSPHQKVEIIPVLMTKDIHLELPCVLINGKHRHKAYRSIFGLWEPKVLKGTYRIYREMVARDDWELHYQYKIPFQQWMTDAEIQIWDS